jgi:DNA-binding XRE family transcriptional regulator
MNGKEFSQVRRHLGRTQTQMAQLMGVSLKAIQSFEQGWRGVSAAAERQLLILLRFKKGSVSRNRPCWSVKECPEESRRKCPAWEFDAGNFCWFINGTLCQGKAPKSWKEKAKACRKCEVFQSVFDLPQGYEQSHPLMENIRPEP